MVRLFWNKVLILKKNSDKIKEIRKRKELLTEKLKEVLN